MNDNNIILGNDKDNQNGLTNSTSFSNSPNVIICNKCGSEMKKDARYCMKCGNLNYLHPKNESMKQYAWQNIKQGHFISGANIENGSSFGIKHQSISGVSPFKTCFITNLVLHIILLVLFVVLFSSDGNIAIGGVISFIVVTILFLFNYSFQCVYIKCSKPWWSYFVPIYGSYVFFEISVSCGWLFLISCIPVIGSIIYLIAYYRLGKKFYKSGILTLLFPFIMIPVIGLDKNCELGVLDKQTSLPDISVYSKGRSKLEREYGKRKFLLTTISFVTIVVILYFGWPYIKPVLVKFYNFFMEQLEFFK